jgi:tripartite-type tricarboxylate transporter receptor subunit TctC
MVRRRLLAMLIATLMGPALAGAAFAQAYPARPITMIVPFPAGGATDTLARYLGEIMRGLLGQPIVIENVGGAAGSLGVARAVRSAADGYTLSIGTSTTHMLTGGLYALQFDLLNDLEPVILIGSEPLLIVGKKSLPADDLKGLISVAEGTRFVDSRIEAHAKANEWHHTATLEAIGQALAGERKRMRAEFQEQLGLLRADVEIATKAAERCERGDLVELPNFVGRRHAS